MGGFSDLDMLYDYDKDSSTAAVGYITFATKTSDQTLGSKFFQLAQEAEKVNQQARSLIEKNGGIS